jgi:3-isopropylmalate/(R)-2-methylmalate dehydratase small subunit
MKAFSTITGIAVPFLEDDVNTDQIAPIPTKRSLKPDYREMFFFRARRLSDDTLNPDQVFNRPQFASPSILVAGRNFGCGSSREGAVYALLDYGIRSVIAPSFGDIHYANELQNGMLPVILPEEICRGLRDQLRAKPGATLSIDLPKQTVIDTEGTAHPFTIDPVYKERLLKGLDDIGLVLENTPAIEAFEHDYHAQRPWLA